MTTDSTTDPVADATGTLPPPRLAERLKNALVHPALHARAKAWGGRRWGEAELALLPFLVPPGRVAVDVGANKGVYTLNLAALAPKVHAFEPHPRLVARLARAVPRHVAVHAMALSDRAGSQIFRVPLGRRGTSNQRGSLNPDGPDKRHVTFPVAVGTLDALDLGDVGFIKVDVEGTELDVLAGGRDLIARCRPTLLVEIEEIHNRRPIETALASVTAMGYRGLYLQHGVLRPLEAFDAERDHRLPFHGDRRGYVYNFIFLAAA